MIGKPAIRGLLVGAARDFTDGSVVLNLKIDRLDYAAFALTAGVPQDAAGHDPADDAPIAPPSVMLLACAEPRHPEGDDDVMARAAFAYLDDLAGRQRPFPRALRHCLSGLIATLVRRLTSEPGEIE